MRRLLILSSTVVFIDVVFYAAITPLLPHYVDDLGLSKAQAGMLTGAYPAGTLLGSLPAGFVAARAGPRRTVVAGLVLMGVSSLVFGFADHLPLLVGARLVQGLAGALTWSGALVWLISATPEGRRGSAIGSVLGIAVAGALLGPPLGALADQVGTAPVFSSVLVITVSLALYALRVPERGRGEKQGLREVWVAMTSRQVIAATWFVAAPSAMFGVFDVLLPLRIHDLGGGAGVVAAGFTAGAALEAVMAPLVGRFSDRAGRVNPYVGGMIVCAAGIVLLPAAQALGLLLAALIVVCFGAGLSFAPAMTMLSDAAEATSLHQGFSAGLTNMAWASGQVVGGVGGGAAAGAAGDGLPCLVAAAILLITAAGAWRGGRRQFSDAGRPVETLG